MVCPIKTALNIDDAVMAELKREAARQGRTMSELVETALRLLLSSQRKRGKIPALLKFRSGGRSSTLPTAMPCTTPWKVASAPPSTPMCWSTPPSAISYRLPRLARAPTGGTGSWHTTCAILYELLRVTTHARVMRRPWSATGGVGLDVTALHAWERSTQELPADNL
jgi:hypothetical protein